DMERYPEYKRMLQQQMAGRIAVNQRGSLPMAVGPVAYASTGPISTEIDAFDQALKASPGRFAETFLTAASPGIVACALKNRHYDTMSAYLKALGEGLRQEYEAIVKAGHILQLDCPELALEHHVSFYGRPLREFQAFVEEVIATINAALANIPRDRV